MSKSTKDRLISAAKRLFSERGFDGVSIADVASELNITKQALLYHFGKKEALYAAVLQDISERFLKDLDTFGPSEGAPEEQLEAFFLAHFRSGARDQEGMRLVMRELLDNHGRVSRAKDWYLRPYLDGLVAKVRAVPSASGRSDEELFAFIYQIIGASSYMTISNATLAGMYGKKRYSSIEAAWRKVQSETIRHFLAGK